MSGGPSFRPVDWCCAGLIAAAAGTLAVILLRDIGFTFFYQQQMPAIVMLACGQPFAQPAVIPEQLLDFLIMRTATFDCRDLGPVAESFPPGIMANAHFYLAASVAYLWRWLGVSYQSLWPLFAILHGAYAAGCFVLGRLFFNRASSVIIGVTIACSPIALSMLYWLRDYSKAPFIIWAIVLLVLAIRAERPRALLLASLMAGVVIGFGSGFRGDVIIMLPVAVGVLAFGSPRHIAVATRMLALALFVIVSVGLIRFKATGGGSGGAGALFLQGASEPFRDYLGLAPAPYDLGWRYLDEIAHTSIAADLRRENPAAYDAGESKPFLGVTQTLTRSTSYVMSWAPLFAADIATRALKSAFLIAGFPALQAADRRVFDPHRIPYPAATPVARAAAPIFAYLAQPWMPVVGSIGVLAFLLRIYGRSPREAACVAATLVILMTSPSLQFAMRHFFHLEFLFWLGIASLLVLPFEIRGLKRALPRFVVWVGCAALGTAGTYVVLVMVQDRLLKREIADLLASPRRAEPIVTTPLPDGRALVQLPVPAEYRSLTEGPPDSMNDPQIGTTPPFQVRAAADRLALTMGGAACLPGPMMIDTVYERKQFAWQPLERQLIIQIPRFEAGNVVVVLPAFYRPTQHLKGFAVSADHTDCLRSIERIEDSRRLPSVLSATLYPDWKETSFHLKLGQ